MPDVNWWQVVPALLGGGAMGAFIRWILDYRASRVQPVTYSLDSDRLFASMPPDAGITAKVAVVHGEKSYGFRNLSLLHLKITNTGNADFAMFPFGLTFSGGDKLLLSDFVLQDRHHKVTFIEPPSPAAPSTHADFVLEPFNRRNSYEIRLYVVLPEASTEPSHVTLSSPVSVTFVKVQSIGEIFRLFGDVESFRIGPFVVTFPARTFRILSSWLIRP